MNDYVFCVVDLVQNADFGISALIAAIISAVVAIGTTATSLGISAKQAAKIQIDDIMYNYVYLQGISLESMKNAYIKLYRNNKKNFEEIYTYYANKRVQDIANGTHTQQKQINQNRSISIVLACIIAVFVFLIIYTIFKKK